MAEVARQARLGKNVKMFRDQVNMTQDDLAARVGFTNGAVISSIEAGEKTPSLWKALDMAIQLGVSLSELVGEHTRSTSAQITNNANGDHQTVYQHVEGGVWNDEWEAKLSAVLVAVLGTQRPLLVEAVKDVVREVVLDLRINNGEGRG